MPEAVLKKLPIASHLSDRDYRLFLRVYADHNRSMGLEQRKYYTLSNVVRIAKNTAEKCLEVHYENGNWWHYSDNGNWY